MNRPLASLLVAALAIARPSIAAAEEEPPESPERTASESDSGWSSVLKASALGGAFKGMGVRRDSGELAILSGALTPVHKSGDWKLEIPLRFAHRQTFGASLSETSGGAGFGAERRVSKGLRLGGDVGLAGAWRPDWPDLYQPDTAGNLALTDRYSFVSWRIGAKLLAIPIAHNHLRIRYRYISYTYRRDPNFDERAEPMHLTPRNHGEHQLEGSWRYVSGNYSTTFGLEYGHREYTIALSRDKWTGLTHYAAEIPNPHQKLDALEPSVEVALKRLGGKLDLSLKYGYVMQTDPFQGYYTYTGHHPQLSVKYGVTDRLVARAKAEAALFEYGPNSKAADQPAGQVGNLETGSRLYDRRGSLSGSIAYEIAKGLAARVEGELIRRDTNYPDYVDGYPPPRTGSGPYDIRWDYTNTQVLAGVEYRL